MTRVQQNRAPATPCSRPSRFRSLQSLRFLRLALPVLLLLVAGGCGGQDEPEARGEMTGETADGGMVPAISESSVVDTASAVVESGEVAGTGAPAAGASSSEAWKPSASRPAPSGAGQTQDRGAKRSPRGSISLQLGSFRSAANAAAEVQRIRELGHTATVEVATLGGETYHRVVIDGLGDRAAAERLGEEIRSRLGITYLIRQK